MASVDPTAVIILSEIILIETLIIIGVVAYLIFHKKKTSNKLKGLLEEYNNAEIDRKSSLKKTFSSFPHLEANDIDPIVENIANNEKQFFHYTVNAFSQKSLSSLDNLHAEIYTLVAPYAEFTQKAASQPRAEDKPIIADTDTIIDELLEDTNDIEEGDPALDLSKSAEEMAEIPDELLSANLDFDNDFTENS